MKPFHALLLAAMAGTSPLRAQDLYYPPIAGNAWETVDPGSLGWCTDEIPALIDFLDQSNTKAFIVLKDGRIAMEHYFGTFTQDSLWYWASAGKSLTAFLVGKAQEDGLLDIDEPSSNYLGEGWTACSSGQESAISIRHQLSMSTGLDDGVPDVDCTDPQCLECLAEPGTRWAYHNAPYTLLDGVIEGATGQTLNAYVFNELTLTTGLQGAFAQLGYNNVFFSKARGMARFGLLCLAQGEWNGTAVMGDASYFTEMTTPSQMMNPAYGYLWWLNGQSSYLLPGLQLQLPGMICPDVPADAYSAMGKNGQLCNVSPATGLVVVRMGDLPTQGVFVPNVYNNEIWQHLNNVICATTGTVHIDLPSLNVQPNPAADIVRISIAGQMPDRISVIAADGRPVIAAQREQQVDISRLPAGSYIVEASVASGLSLRQRLIVAR